MEFYETTCKKSEFTIEHLTKDPSDVTISYDKQLCWKRPYLWLDVSTPAPLMSPPTVKSSNSGTTGMVHPMAFSVEVN